MTFHSRSTRFVLDLAGFLVSHIQTGFSKSGFAGGRDMRVWFFQEWSHWGRCIVKIDSDLMYNDGEQFLGTVLSKDTDRIKSR